MSEQFIGDYRVLRKIGAGGMAKVYLAVHQNVPNLKVILKILGDPSLGDRFRQEADKLALLDGHPNICRIKHFFSHGEDTVIAMEYIDGVSLDDRISREGRIPIPEAISIVTRVLDTLQFAHEKGINHRDIKPSNIMIDQQGQVKVIDFGIAKSKTDPNLTMAGATCGTPAYMPPEQFNPKEDTNYALADIYALGTTLYLMLTGELPFKGDNEFALRDAKLFTEAPKPRSLNPAIHKQLEAVVVRALDKNPMSRFESALAMKQALEAVPVDGGAAPEKTVAVMKSGSEGRRGRSRLPVFAGIVVLAVATVGGWLFLKPGVNHPPKLMAIADQTLKPGARLRFAIAASDEDKTNPILSAENLPDNATFAPANGLFDWTPSENQIGAHRITFVATDHSDASLRDTHVVTYTVEGVTADGTPPAMATLAISVRPRGDVFVDGVLKGSSVPGMSVPVTAGTHIIMVKNERAVERVRVDTVDVASGETERRTYAFTFTPEVERTEVVTPSATGELRISSRPTVGAQIYIDGELQARPTPNTYSVSAGAHSIRAFLDVGGEVRELSKDVQVAPDSTVRVEFNFAE
ncbi:MAG: protein kinase [Candidatus Zixiibacteriota bacterium]